METIGYWHKNKHIGQWNRVENSEINPHIDVQLISKEPRIYNGQESLFNKWCWENRTATCKIMTLRLHRKINSNASDLNVRPKSIKPLEKNIGDQL